MKASLRARGDGNPSFAFVYGNLDKFFWGSPQNGLTSYADGSDMNLLTVGGWSQRGADGF